MPIEGDFAFVQIHITFFLYLYNGLPGLRTFKKFFSCLFITHKVQMNKKYHTQFHKILERQQEKSDCVFQNFLRSFQIYWDNGLDFHSLEFRILKKG